ncbi:hypothetical protein ACTXT7_007094 [Hymenolepis weldensis]
MRKRKEHCQPSADSLKTPKFVRRVHDTIDENRGKSMSEILPKILKCLKKQQYVRNVVHQDLGYKSCVLRRGRQFMSTKTTRENCIMCAKPLLNKLEHPEEEQCLWFFPVEKNLHQNERINRRNNRWLLRVNPTEVPTVMHAREVSSNSDAALNRQCSQWKKTPYVFQQDSAPSHKALKTQDWMAENFPHHVTPNSCPSPNYSPDFNHLHY